MLHPQEKRLSGPRPSGWTGKQDAEEGIDAFIAKRKPVWKDA
jgi:hypothetical protein